MATLYNKTALKKIKKDELSPATVPAVDVVADGSYPLIIDFYVYFSAARADGPLLKFVNYCVERAPKRAAQPRTDEGPLYAQKKAGITVTELMQRTDCTIAEARRVIDAIEFGE